MTKKLSVHDASPKMTRRQAKVFWNALSPSQKSEFNILMQKMNSGELMLSHVNVDDNEQIQNVILEPKNKPGKPAKPFYDLFKQDKK